MIRYLLDTNIVSELIRNPDGAAAKIIWDRSAEICTSIIVVAELHYGFRKNPSARRERLAAAVLEAIPIAAWEHPSELHYANLRVALEAAGIPIGGNDMLIAAHALALDCTLVTANEREFRRVPGLKVENWLAADQARR